MVTTTPPRFPLRVYLDESGWPSKNGTAKVQAFGGICVYGFEGLRLVDSAWPQWRRSVGLSPDAKGCDWSDDFLAPFANFLVSHDSSMFTYGSWALLTSNEVKAADQRIEARHALAKTLPFVDKARLEKLRTSGVEELWQHQLLETIPPIVISVLPNMGPVDSLEFRVGERVMHGFAKFALSLEYESYTSPQMIRLALTTGVDEPLLSRIANHARWGNRVSLEFDSSSPGAQMADAMTMFVARVANGNVPARIAMETMRDRLDFRAPLALRSLGHGAFLARDVTENIRRHLRLPLPGREEALQFVQNHPIPRPRIDAFWDEHRESRQRQDPTT